MLYFRRLIWFIAGRMLLICALVGMLVCGFFMCLNMANIYVILDEGLEKRVEVILTREEAEEMKARLIEAGDDPAELSIEAVRIGRGF